MSTVHFDYRLGDVSQDHGLIGSRGGALLITWTWSARVGDGEMCGS